MRTRNRAMASPVLVFVVVFAVVTHTAARSPQLKRHTGNIFSFHQHGGAAAYMRRLQQEEPHTARRILQRAAASSLVSLDHFHRALDTDASLGLDLDAGTPIFECPGARLEEIPGIRLDPGKLGIGGQDLLAGDPDPLAPQAFNLSSRTNGANGRKIYLDFLGGVVTGTAWNTKRGDITIPTFDFDGDSSSFSGMERNAIAAVWRQVAEDYAAFEVDVTTIKPPNYKNATHVMIGGDGSWYGSAGGVAYMSVFGDPLHMPAFIFPKNLGPDYPKYVAEAVSHEVGHTLSLLHDGDNTGPYYGGQGDWAPIMGIGYYKQVTQFDKGEYKNANNPQDDFAAISKYLPVLKQQAGNNIASATPLTDLTGNGTMTVAKANGIVSDPTAANFYSFTANGGTATITVGVQLAWEEWDRANLDAQVVVYDAAGGAIGPPINPTGVDSLNGLGIFAAPVTLPVQGMYYVAVSGSGAGDPLVDGYTNYGSRGQFWLTVTYPTIGVAQPEQPSPPPNPEPVPDPPSPSPQDTSTSENPGNTDTGASPEPPPDDSNQNPEPSPSPSPNPQPAITLSLLSQFPAGFTPSELPDVGAAGETDSCIFTPAAIKGFSAADDAPDLGKCTNSLQGGRYTLSAGPIPTGTQFARWECYGVSQGQAWASTFGDFVDLAPGDSKTCVAVYAEAPSSPSPEPSPASPPSPTPKVGPPSQQMIVAAINLDKTCSAKGTACTCTATVSVHDRSTAQPVRGVTVKGVWSSQPQAWGAFAQVQQTTKKGLAYFKAAKQPSGGTCSLVVQSLSKQGYAFNAKKSAPLKKTIKTVPQQSQVPKASPKAKP